MSLVRLYVNRPAAGQYIADREPAYRILALGDAPSAAPACDWCATRRAGLEVNGTPLCTECTATLTARGRRA